MQNKLDKSMCKRWSESELRIIFRWGKSTYEIQDTGQNLRMVR